MSILKFKNQLLFASVATTLLVCGWTSPVLAQDTTCSSQGSEAPLSLHADWIMQGWERNEGDPDFVFADKMTRYYDIEDTTGIFYDNFAPGETQLFGNSAEYGANWEGLQNAARSVKHGLTNGHDQILGDTVASTTLGFVGLIDRLDGQQIAFDGRSQIGWVCTDGAWKIRHEMNYAWVVEPSDIAPVLGHAELD